MPHPTSSSAEVCLGEVRLVIEVSTWEQQVASQPWRTPEPCILAQVEGLYDMGNLAAVCRSADAFGMGAVHCINTT